MNGIQEAKSSILFSSTRNFRGLREIASLFHCVLPYPAATPRCGLACGKFRGKPARQWPDPPASSTASVKHSAVWPSAWPGAWQVGNALGALASKTPRGMPASRLASMLDGEASFGAKKSEKRRIARRRARWKGVQNSNRRCQKGSRRHGSGGKDRTWAHGARIPGQLRMAADSCCFRPAAPLRQRRGAYWGLSAAWLSSSCLNCLDESWSRSTMTRLALVRRTRAPDSLSCCVSAGAGVGSA